MKKNSLFLALFCLLCSLGATAQCSFSGPWIAEQFRRDTTFEVVYIDTLAFAGSGNSYSWSFDNGATYTGTVARHPITLPNTTFSYTLSVTGPGCTSVESSGGTSGIVFNCSQLAHTQVSDYNAAQIFFATQNYYDTNLKTHMVVNFGNHHVDSATQPTDNVSAVGGPTDIIPNHYTYGGQYKINISYNYLYDTMTCPTEALPPFTIHVAGPTPAPVFIGTKTYCVGDTLRIRATDTSAQFHNIYHRADTTGVGPRDLYPWNVAGGSSVPFTPNYTIGWFDRNDNQVGGNDSLFTLNNLTVQDSGIYYLHMYEQIEGTDTMFAFHITVDSALPHAGTITGTATVCQAATISLSNSITGGTWSSSTAAATVAGGVVTGTAAGTATISYAVANGCGIAVDTMEVTVNPLPNAGSISGSTSVCEGSTTTLAETVSGGIWTSANPMIATISATGVINTVAPGTASINYTVSNSCGTTAAAYNVTVDPATVCNPTGVANTAISSVISIYPNPANGPFTVEVPQADNNAVITITDMSGKVMSVVTPNTKNVKIPVVLNLASGTYLIKVDAAGKVYRDKLVIW